jgi:hypothetical protein
MIFKDPKVITKCEKMHAALEGTEVPKGKRI